MDEEPESSVGTAGDAARLCEGCGSADCRAQPVPQHVPGKDAPTPTVGALLRVLSELLQGHEVRFALLLLESVAGCADISGVCLAGLWELLEDSARRKCSCGAASACTGPDIVGRACRAPLQRPKTGGCAAAAAPTPPLPGALPGAEAALPRLMTGRRSFLCGSPLLCSSPVDVTPDPVLPTLAGTDEQQEDEEEEDRQPEPCWEYGLEPGGSAPGVRSTCRHKAGLTKLTAFRHSKTEEYFQQMGQKSGWWIVHPNGVARSAWDSLTFLAVVFEAVTVPVTVAFDVEASLLLAFSVTTIIFAVDIVANFVTGYFHDGALVMQQQLIIRHYLSTWFPLDFLTTFPWDLVLQVDSPLRIMRLKNLMRGFRFLRIMKMRTLAGRMDELVSPHLTLFSLKLGKICVVFALVCHWAACLWSYLGSPENSASARPSPEDCEPGGACEPGIEGSPWRRRYGSENYSLATQYLQALSAMAGLVTGTGGDILPGYWAERLFHILMSIVSFLVCTMILSHMMTVVEDDTREQRKVQERLRSIKGFMMLHRVPMTLQAKVQNYLKHSFSMEALRTAQDLQLVREQLPSQLASELSEALHAPVLARHAFFAGMWRPALRRLSQLAELVVHSPGDLVAQRGDAATGVSFVVSGLLHALPHGERSSEVICLEPPACFGDRSLFSPSPVLRPHSILAVRPARLLRLERERLLGVLGEFPLERERYALFAAQAVKGRPVFHCSRCGQRDHIQPQCPQPAVTASHRSTISGRHSFAGSLVSTGRLSVGGWSVGRLGGGR